jgi:CheY-like chemotaxis protein
MNRPRLRPRLLPAESMQAMVSGVQIPSAERKMKILLVDDTPENLVSLEAALSGLGEELVLARSGTEALRRLLQDDFAVILLDVRMPEMDGFETAELIRSRPRSKHVPILFLTGYRSEEHLFRGYGAPSRGVAARI